MTAMRYSEVLKCIFILSAAAFSSCDTGKKQAPMPVKHLAEAGWRGSAGIYADRVPNKAILKDEGPNTARSFFYCLRIGFYDSTATGDAKQQAAREKYFQLDMYKDWVLLCDKDSIAPVFYQPAPKKETSLTEQVLVYELPKGMTPKTLVYKDPYGLLGNHHILHLEENNLNK